MGFRNRARSPGRVSPRGRSRRWQSAIRAATQWLLELQWDEGEQVDEANWYYGGFGYTRGRRPDLSNTQFSLLALEAARVPATDGCWKKAERFVTRCQNYKANDLRKADGDGGFIYHPHSSKAGGTTSYGSMTAAGVWSLLLTGVGPRDERVSAALRWLESNYGWDRNPGMPDATTFVYYNVMTLSKALMMAGQRTFAGRDWAADLSAFLAGQQRPDGSWVNPNGAAMEDSPAVCTAFGAMALEACTRPQIPAATRVTWALGSPAVLQLYDEHGNCVGRDPDTGELRWEIPNARVVEEGGKEAIRVFEPMAGQYRARVIGTGKGSYDLRVTAEAHGKETSSETYTRATGTGHVEDVPLLATSVAGPITTYVQPALTAAHLRYPKTAWLGFPVTTARLPIRAASLGSMSYLTCDMSFDPDYIRVREVIPGEVFEGEGAAWAGAEIDNDNGWVRNLGGSLPFERSDREKVFATIVVQARAALWYGQSRLGAVRGETASLTDTVALDAEGRHHEAIIGPCGVWSITVPLGALAVLLLLDLLVLLGVLVGRLMRR
jgi:hypothetical protein